MTSLRRRATLAFWVAALIAVTRATAFAAPSYATLVVRHGVPVPLQSSADAAVFSEAEQFAESYQLYFRVNPVVPDAEHRNAMCVPGTTALLSSEVALSYDLSGSGRDSLVVRVSLAPCASVNAALRGESNRMMPARSVDALTLGSSVHEAFAVLRRHIDQDPGAAQALGISVAPP